MNNVNSRIAELVQRHTKVEVETPKYKYSAVREFLDLRVTGKDLQPVDPEVKDLMGYGRE